MSKLEKILLSLSITLTVFAIVLVFVKGSQPVYGSVSIANEYMSTTTDSTFNSTCKILNSNPGGLGSVVVTLGSNASMALYDGTTTAAHNSYATSTLAIFKTTATAGTYSFDSRFVRGLEVCSDSTVGVASTTITFR